MCYKLRKHEDSIGEISAKRPLVGKHLDQDKEFKDSRNVKIPSCEAA